MKLSKKTQNKIWAMTQVVTSQYESDKKASEAKSWK